MVTVIKRGTSLEQIRKQLRKLRTKKQRGFNAKKYLGVLSSDIDPVAYQKKIRNEWQ